MVVDNLSELKVVTPIVICGAARSGTRMMTDIVNAHSEIVVQEEMHAKTIEAFFNFSKIVDNNFSYYSERKGYDLSAHWERSKSALLLSFFTYANKKTEVGHGKAVKLYGIKTPGYERYLDEFESVFSNEKPYYIYCQRNPSSVWRSWKSLGYLDDYKLFLARYKRSIRQAVKIKNSVQERFVLFDLDAFILSENKSDFIEKNIYRKLPVSREASYKQIESLENRNSIKKKSGSNYINNNNLENEMSLISKDEKLNNFLEILKSNV